MAESDNESDFASAESDQEDTSETTKEQEQTTKPETDTEGQKESQQSELDSGKGDAPTKSEVSAANEEKPLEEGMSGETPIAGEHSSPEAQEKADDSKCKEEDITATAEGAKAKAGKVSLDTPPVSGIGEESSTDSPQKKQQDGGDEEAISEEGTAVIQEGSREERKEEEKEEERKEEEDQSKEASGGGGWGWGGWSSLWSSVSTVTESAQALGHKVSSVIASVEDTLGLPSPQEMAKTEGEEGEGEGGREEEETRKLAEEIVEHDVPPEDKPVLEEPHPDSIPARSHGMEPELEPDSKQQSVGFAGFFSGIASAVQTTGKGLVSGGLDALETLGKKTMEVLSEGDPGFRKKRAMLTGVEAPSLSQLLREAKSESEAAAQRREAGDGSDSMYEILSYSRLFDEYQGVVHLEALELLSKECETKVRSGLSSFSGDEFQAAKEELDKIAQAFKVEEQPEVLDDDSSRLPEVMELFSDITLPLKVDKLIKVSSSWREKVDATSSGSPSAEDLEETKTSAKAEKEEDKATETEMERETKMEGETEIERENKMEGETEMEGENKMEGETEMERETEMEKVETETKTEADARPISEVLYENGLRSLAELTSASVELFRKMAEVSLLPIPKAQKSDSLTQTQKLNRLTVLVSSELDALASVHAEAITKLEAQGSNSSVTSLYLEASNSCSYVQDAFQLLAPVLQYSAIQDSLVREPSTNVHARS